MRQLLDPMGFEQWRYELDLKHGGRDGRRMITPMAAVCDLSGGRAIFARPLSSPLRKCPNWFLSSLPLSFRVVRRSFFPVGELGPSDLVASARQLAARQYGLPLVSGAGR